jgi:peroxiredoxin
MATKRIVLLLAITALLIAATAAPALALLTNGQTAPNFQLTDLSGTSHTLNEYRGKVVVIDFFGWGCGYCQSDAKDTLVPLYNNYFKNDPNVQFLGVEVDGGSISQDQGFVQETGASWPILTAGGSVFSAYQAVSTPTLYVISPTGTVASSSTYPTNAATLKSTIDSLEGRAQGPAPAACSWGSGRLDVFVQGTDGALWHKGGTGTWPSWQSLGGKLTSSPAATSPGNNLIDVFARGTDGAVWYKVWDGTTWSSWQSLGGQIPTGTAPAACSWGSGLDVFVQGTDGALWYKAYTGTWSNWQSLGGKLTSSPAATSPGNTLIDVFARGTDGAVWYKA